MIQVQTRKAAEFSPYDDLPPVSFELLNILSLACAGKC